MQDVAKGIGLDGRIGPKFLHAGPGYGGSCFPKDTLALARTAAEAGHPLRIVEAVCTVNDERKGRMADRIVAACGGYGERITDPMNCPAPGPGRKNGHRGTAASVVECRRLRGNLGSMP